MEKLAFTIGGKEAWLVEVADVGWYVVDQCPPPGDDWVGDWNFRTLTQDGTWSGTGALYPRDRAGVLSNAERNADQPALSIEELEYLEVEGW